MRLDSSGWVSLGIIASSLAVTLSCAKPEPPQVTPRAARVTAIGPLGLGLAVDVEVYNPNSFPLVAREVKGTLELGSGIALGTGQATPATSIAAKSSSLVSTQLNVGWTNLGAVAQFAASDKAVPFTFRGLATIGGERLNLDLPFKIVGELTREQLLQAGMRGLGPMGLPLP